MNILLEIVLSLLLCSSGFHLFYWAVLRPVLLDMSRARAEQILHESARLHHAQSSQRDRVAVDLFRKMCGSLPKDFAEIDAADVWMAIRNKSAPAHVRENAERMAECEDLAPMLSAHATLFLGIILVNSPIVLPCFAAIYTASLWFTKARQTVEAFRLGALAVAGPSRFVRG